jgi:capsular exopolysaccharide synthesis family protein
VSAPVDPQTEPQALPPGRNGAGLVPGARNGGPVAIPDPRDIFAYPVEPEEAHFWDYWRVIVRHRWTVLSFFLVTVLVVTVWTFTTRPVYSSTATVRIEKEEPRVLKFEEVVREDNPQQDYYQTQFKILESRSLAARVIGLLALDQHPEFLNAEDRSVLERVRIWSREQLVRWLPVPPPPTPQAAEDLALESPLTEAFHERLAVEPVRNARLVRVSFRSYYPDLAARVANTLAEAFIAQNMEQKVEATRYATQFLGRQMEEARDRLEVSEQKLNDFLKANDIVFVTPDRLGERQDLVTQQLMVLSDALLRARSERITKEAAIQQALSQDVDAIPAVLQNELVGRLKGELVTLEGDYRRLAQTFKTEYPRMQRLEQNIAEVRRQLRAEVRRVIESLDADYRAALRSERELQKGLDDHRVLARRLGDQLVQYGLLRRDIDTSRELYTALLTRLKETQISSALLVSNISVVDRAEMPLDPARPRKGLNLLLATLVGLVGGVGLAFFFEYLDTNIKDPKEVETVLRVPTIGLVPSRHAVEASRRARRRRLGNGNGDHGGPFALVAHAEMESLLSESFRNLRTSLLYSSPDHPPRTLMVTSLQPEDGKTSLATNLAITLAQLGHGEVLLVDGDMRRPNLHDIMDVTQAPGFSTFLTGQAELPAVMKASRVPNLYVIPAGRVPVNPAELLASARLRQALDVLGERFAHVVFDAPPLLGLSDAMVLAPHLEGVVLVLRHGRASRDSAQRAIHLLRSVRARLLGVVLNDVDVRKGAGYYGSSYYYGYGYGSGSGSRA